MALADSPTTKEDCKHGGYAKYGFKNQAQCIKAVKHATPADTTPPEIQITQGPAEGSVSSEQRFVISSNEPVQFYYDMREATYTGQPTYSVLGNPNSTEVDLNFNAGNAEGKEMVFYLKAVDAAGNVTELQRRWTVEAAPPTVAITSGPEEGSTVDTNTVSFGWEATDNLEVWEVECYLAVVGTGEVIQVDGSEPGDNFCGGTRPAGLPDNPATFSNLPDGRYTFHVRVLDESGHGVSAERTFTVDTTL